MCCIVIGVLALPFALTVSWILLESGHALAAIAAAIFAGLALVSLDLERVLENARRDSRSYRRRARRSSRATSEVRDRNVASASVSIPASRCHREVDLRHVSRIAKAAVPEHPMRTVFVFCRQSAQH
jgi:hypothetical protein